MPAETQNSSCRYQKNNKPRNKLATIMLQVVCMKISLNIKYFPKLKLAKNNGISTSELPGISEIKTKRTFFRMTTHTPNPHFL